MVPTSKSNPKQSIEDWRREEYLAMGFTDYQTQKLVDLTGLSVGSVRRVVQQGCKIDVAYRIFRP